MHNLDDYAWYEVGNRRYFNKVQAVMDATASHLPVRWNVNDAVLDQYKWDQEPKESLDQLYAQRAQQIREKYDYLVLHFSGGTDSGQVLETFIDHNIHLDEICTRGSYSVTPQKTGRTTAAEVYSEILTQSLPLAQWAKDTHMPHVKIRVVDTTQILHDFYDRTPDWTEFSPQLTPSGLFKGNIDLLHTDYARMADKGIKVAHIVGMEKPVIYRHKNYFYTKYHDKREMDWVAESISASHRPQYIELFFWGINAVKLRIKQLHVLKNAIKKHNLPDSVFDWRQGRPYESWVAPLIYKRTMPIITEHEKDVTNSIIKDRDWWFTKDANSQAVKNFAVGIDIMSQQISPEWWHTENNFWRKGLKMMWSKPRYLGT